MLSRRKFLFLSGSSISTLALPGLWVSQSVIARADAMNPRDPDHFFVLIRTSGGMDVTLGLDPQVYRPGIDQNDVFLEYGPDDIITAGGIRLAPPAAPLKPFAGDMAIVNGIFMSSSDLGHQTGNLYAASGSTHANPATFPFILGFGVGTGPFGVITSGSSDSATNGLVVSTAQAVLAGQIYDDNLTSVIGPVVKGRHGTSSLGLAENALVESTTVGPKVKAILDTLRQKQVNLTENHALAAAFAGGGARQGEVVMDNLFQPLDSHTNHPGTHSAAQQQVWTNVAQMFSDFKSVPYKNKSVFDYTTFMVVSEFSRTPALNQSKGKDHNNLTNSILLAGRGIGAGRVYGRSIVVSRKKTQDGNPVHMGMPLDFRSGGEAKTQDNAEFLRPENVAASIAAMFGRPDGFPLTDAKPIPGLAKI